MRPTRKAPMSAHWYTMPKITARAVNGAERESDSKKIMSSQIHWAARWMKSRMGDLSIIPIRNGPPVDHSEHSISKMDYS